MRRLAIVLTALAVALALPVTVLVARALESAAVEEQNRHRLVAERAFDEMEAALSRLLDEEEARSFDAYRFYPEGAPPLRSPLADAPSAPFVLGYFQIDPDGSLHTPRIPRDPDVARARGDFAPSEQTRELLETLESAWRRADTTRARYGARELFELEKRELEQDPQSASELSDDETLAASRDRSTNDLPLQAIGYAKDSATTGRANLEEKLATASEVGGALPAAAPSTPGPAPRRKAPTDADELDSYSVYRSFNLAEKRRQARQPKVARVAKKTLAAARSAPTPERPASADAQASAASEAIAEEARTVQVAVDPMIGRGSPGDRLILVRTVVASEQAYRQGLLVDWRLLGDWLYEQVVAPSALGRADLRTSFAPASASPNAHPASGYSFNHRFAEPFDVFAVELQLPVLPGGRGTGTIHALAVLLALVAGVGLLAVYRMASVVVQFAERRSRFAASVSHELKTPLTSIRMYAEMLRDGLVPNDEKRSEYYHTITDESERLSRLIDNVLEFSRLERGEAELRASRGNLTACVAEALEKLAPHAARQGFTLEFERSSEPLEAIFDPDAVTQIVFNAVDNALKYAREASPRRVELKCSHEGAHSTLRIRDHGPGLPPAELGRVFEPFYRREEEATRGTGGSGIGLALVRELAESMGGSARAENAPGGGLEISVQLPRAPSS